MRFGKSPNVARARVPSMPRFDLLEISDSFTEAFPPLFFLFVLISIPIKAHLIYFKIYRMFEM